MIDDRRVRPRNNKAIAPGTVMYWMQRDQRVQDNWALLYAAQCAKETKEPLHVVFNLVPRFGDTTLRHYNFMLRGLAEVESELRRLGIPFYLLQGEPAVTISAFVREYQIGHVVTDQNPLRFTDAWRAQVGEALSVRLTEVDAHNIVPVWVASPKLEFAAYTLRPKIHRLLPEFLTKLPKLVAPDVASVLPSPVHWADIEQAVVTNRAVSVADWITPGASAAHAALAAFCDAGLDNYATKRNDPNLNHLSHLSPYLHFGQLSAQRIALAVQSADADIASRDAYLEELIVRRELSDNYCFYNSAYDTVAGAHAWAQTTINAHTNDVRSHLYTLAEFEAGETHDELWNAAQRQMTQTGKMHGFMRMYWAKKILEWTPDVQTAITTALYLNDTYELDGTDPNGVTGVMWSICGVHDRAWTERPVFGKIRYMNYAGCKRKFDVKAYEEKYSQKTSPALF